MFNQAADPLLRKSLFFLLLLLSILLLLEIKEHEPEQE